MSDRWYVVTAQPGREGVAELHLRRQGFEVWMPRQLRIVSRARRRQEKLVPLFPGYMFVSLDIDRDRWRPINGTFGVRSLLMQGERPLPCPRGLVEGLRAWAGGEGVVKEQPALRPGDAVCVVSGPLSQMAGKLIRLDDAGRARVLLRIMRGEVVVTLDVYELSPGSA